MLSSMNPVSLIESAPMLDRNNIINQRDGESLYQICLKLRHRLSEVPNFRSYLDQMAHEEAEGVDPVSSLWKCFRSGLPLLTIYNASQPEDGDLTVDPSNSDLKMGKQAAYRFNVACKTQMSIPASDIFSLNDLYGDNTTGFVKVTKQVNRVLDILSLSGKLYPSQESLATRDESSDVEVNGGAPRQLTRRQHILKELVETERQYVHHLLNLQALKKELEECGALTGDSIHSIFLNLNNLLDFTQRFLIRIEQHNELPEKSQNWGELFIHYKEPFRQYEPFIANQLQCEKTCSKEWEKMTKVGRSPLMDQMLADPTILSGFLLKPFQRLTKYPLFLKDLASQCTDVDLQADLSDAVEIIQGVLQEANAAIDKETRQNALLDLDERVEEWKSLNLNRFGELMLFGTFTVLKGDGSSKDQEKEYHIYLFERILICCKDVNSSKQKSKYMGSKEKLSVTAKGQPRLQLKGRIFLANVTHIMTASGPGNYTIQIFWKGDPGLEHFVIRFKNEDTMLRWNREIDKQRALRRDIKASRANGTSETQFTSLRGIQMDNPHQEYDLDDEDYDRGSQGGYAGYENGHQHLEFNRSRNASSVSLRSSLTGATNGAVDHFHPSARPPRFPMPDPTALPPLNTSFQNSPADRGGHSYFSPVEREGSTPMSASARSSSQSAWSGYNRYGTPSNGWSNAEEPTNRNTAPAMPRSNTGGNPYMFNGRDARMRPSLPPVATAPPTAQQLANGVNRLRSASSPDFGNPSRRTANGQVVPNGSDVPTVPAIPPHVAGRVAPVNRSMSNSPTGGPPRAHTPSANGQGYGGPAGSRPHMTSHYTYDSSYNSKMDPRHAASNLTPGSSNSTIDRDRALSPSLSTPSSDGEAFMPSQLKAKVCFDNNYITLVIASNIQFRSLTDRIDAKLARFTQASIGGGSVRLRYRDEDGDYIWIDSDEAVHDAFLDWRETHADKIAAGTVGEILLFCSSLNGEPLAAGR